MSEAAVAAFEVATPPVAKVSNTADTIAAVTNAIEPDRSGDVLLQPSMNSEATVLEAAPQAKGSLQVTPVTNIAESHEHDADARLADAMPRSLLREYSAFAGGEQRERTGRKIRFVDDPTVADPRPLIVTKYSEALHYASLKRNRGTSRKHPSLYFLKFPHNRCSFVSSIGLVEVKAKSACCTIS
jgi:hypothetical protein